MKAYLHLWPHLCPEFPLCTITEYKAEPANKVFFSIVPKISSCLYTKVFFSDARLSLNPLVVVAGVAVKIRGVGNLQHHCH